MEQQILITFFKGNVWNSVRRIHQLIGDIFQGAIVIHEVYEDGAAAKDGRLWAGDQILEVRWPSLCVTVESLLSGQLRLVVISDETLLGGQPLLSGHLPFPRGWSLNRGRGDCMLNRVSLLGIRRVYFKWYDHCYNTLVKKQYVA